MTVCVYMRNPYLLIMGAFVKQIPVSETIFGNIKKPPDIIHEVVFLRLYFIHNHEQILLS